MHCPMICICILLALLVLLGGLFLLAYAKKEGLGMMTKIASYLAILVSIGCIVCCVACCFMCKPQHCKGGKCGPHGMRMEKEVIIMKGDSIVKKECCKKEM